MKGDEIKTIIGRRVGAYKNMISNDKYYDYSPANVRRLLDMLKYDLIRALRLEDKN